MLSSRFERPMIVSQRDEERKSSDAELCQVQSPFMKMDISKEENVNFKFLLIKDYFKLDFEIMLMMYFTNA